MADYEGVDVANATCKEPGCTRARVARGWCQSHYGKRYRAGLIQPELPLTERHSLSEVDAEARRAVCAVCGPVAIRLRTGGRASECMTVRRRNRGKGKKGRRASPEAARRYRLRSKYGISDLRDVSDDPGTCPICRRTDQPMNVDHDHSCCPGKSSCGDCVRGVICRDCNWGIGRFRDDPDALARAIDYLRRR